MIVGVKIGQSAEKKYLDEISKYADFFELYVRIGDEFDFLPDYNKPVVIHVPHSVSAGSNFADPLKKEINLAALQWAKKLGDKFNSSKLIFHAESAENKNCNLKNTINFVKQNYDKRMLIENMPYSTHGIQHICCTAAEIKKVMSESKVGFCLDLAHAVEYAAIMKINIDLFLKEMLSLKPKHFHLSDSIVKTTDKENKVKHHLNLFDGEIDLNMVKRLIPKNASITLETPHNFEKQKREIEFLKK